MIKFAFCYEHDDILDFVKNEVQNCMRQREVEISAMCCHNAGEPVPAGQTRRMCCWSLYILCRI